VHRIGRTGRAGQDGAALSLVCVDEHAHLADIEKLLKRQIDQVIVPGYEPDPSIRPEPVRKGGSNRAHKGGRRSGAKAAAGNRSRGRSGRSSGSKGRNWRSAA